jgi:hypothetical protein
MKLRACVNVNAVLSRVPFAESDPHLPSGLQIESSTDGGGCLLWYYRADSGSSPWAMNHRIADYWMDSVDSAKAYALKFYLVPLDAWEVIEP